MSNNTIISNSITLSLDELLDSLGFDHWKTLVASFVFPTISLIGTCLCSLSAWIFYQSHYYLDSNNQKQITTFYYLNSSVFSMTSFGKSVLIFTVLFLNQLLTLLVGILLNKLSVYKFKKYLQFKRHIKHETQQQQSEVDRELSQKELDEFKAEKNMFIMALFLCTLSILSRCLIMFYYVYALIYDASSLTQTFGLLNYMVFTMVPSMGVFVFYSFNKMFRQEFKRKFWF
jgi:hypothetical protein